MIRLFVLIALITSCATKKNAQLRSRPTLKQTQNIDGKANTVEANQSFTGKGKIVERHQNVDSTTLEMPKITIAEQKSMLK